jgi:hypothetical protein
VPAKPWIRPQPCRTCWSRAGCRPTGSGPRRLLQGSLPPQQTYTTLDINWGNSSLVETTYAVASGQPVAWSRLPATLMGRAGVLNRNVQARSIRR